MQQGGSKNTIRRKVRVTVYKQWSDWLLSHTSGISCIYDGGHIDSYELNYRVEVLSH